jgi:hypothetical protein
MITQRSGQAPGMTSFLRISAEVMIILAKYVRDIPQSLQVNIDITAHLGQNGVFSYRSKILNAQ